MNRVSGMTIKQFNESVEEMRTVYKFNDESARIEDFHDMQTGFNRQVCIHAIDDKTGVEIVMCKGAKIGE